MTDLDKRIDEIKGSVLVNSDWENSQGINFRWLGQKGTTTKSPVLQYIERCEGCKNGERYYFERWVDVPLIIEE